MRAVGGRDVAAEPHPLVEPRRARILRPQPERVKRARAAVDHFLDRCWPTPRPSFAHEPEPRAISLRYRTSPPSRRSSLTRSSATTGQDRARRQPPSPARCAESSSAARRHSPRRSSSIRRDAAASSKGVVSHASVSMVMRSPSATNRSPSDRTFESLWARPRRNGSSTFHPTVHRMPRSGWRRSPAVV